MVRKIFLWVFSFMLAASPVLADSQGSATGGTAGTQSTLAGGIYKATPPTLTDGQQVGLQTDANGQLKVTVSGGGSNACASATGSAVPSSACANGLNVSGTLRGQTGTNTSGSVYAGDTNVVQSALPTGAATSANQTSQITQETTTATNTGTIATNTGTTATNTGTTATGIGAPGDTACASDNGTCSAIALIKRTNQNVTTLNTTAGSAIPAGTAVIGKVGIDQTTPGTTNAVQMIPGTAGGLTMSTFEPGASDNHTNLKNGAGQVYEITAFNNSATINYLRLYNAATGFNGCNSATNLVAVFHIPANTSDAGFIYKSNVGIPFSTGISYCVVSAYGQATTTSATASAMDINIGYK